MYVTLIIILWYVAFSLRFVVQPAGVVRQLAAPMGGGGSLTERQEEAFAACVYVCIYVCTRADAYNTLQINDWPHVVGNTNTRIYGSGGCYEWVLL